MHIVYNIYIHIYICISYVNDMYTSIVNVSTRTSQNGARKRPTEDRYLSLSIYIYIYTYISSPCKLPFIQIALTHYRQYFCAFLTHYGHPGWYLCNTSIYRVALAWSYSCLVGQLHLRSPQHIRNVDVQGTAPNRENSCVVDMINRQHMNLL